MPSTLTKQADPHDVFLIESVLAACAKLSHSEPADRTVSPPLAPQAHIASGVAAAASAPKVDATFRASDVDHVEVPPDKVHGPLKRPSNGRWVMRASLGFVFALASAMAAAAWQHYGDAAMQTIANWTPPFALVSSPPPAAPVAADQPDSPVDQASAADATQAAPPAQPAQDAAPPPAAAAAPDPAPLPPSVARDLAAMGQQIEQLKASIEQLKAGQEEMAKQMSRDVAAKTSEQVPRQKLSALPPRPAAPPPRKPRPAFSPAQATAVPAAPAPAPLPPPAMAAAPIPPPPQAQPMTEPDGEPVVRPPMPVR